MKKLYILVLFAFMATPAAFGQYYTNENMNWAFGTNAGVSFISGAPVPISTAIFSHEGCASVSDSVGSLLFYTDGDTVYDRTGGRMPSGKAIARGTTLSTTQGTVIAPVIGKWGQYYVFSLADNGTLSSSIVDMTLHGGLGDVVTASSSTLITDTLTEKMTVIGGHSCDIWLLVHQISHQRFLAYHIDATGFNNTPVISAVGAFTGRGCYHTGVMKGSPDRTKIIAVCEIGAELFDFDATTGIVSNSRVLNTNYSYGAEFSPDNTKLYIVEQTPYDELFQYDISLSGMPAIVASMTGIAPCNRATDLKLAPDNKIYMGDLGGISTPYLDCISAPNLAGMSCGYIPQAVHLLSPDFIGLPNLYVSFPPVSAGIITGDSILCINHSIVLSDASPGGSWISADSFNIVSGACVINGNKYGSDTVLYVVSNGCISDTARHIIFVQEACPSLQAAGITGKELALFPNPAGNELNISAPYAITGIAISDLFGRQVYSGVYNAGTIRIDVADLRAGVYLIKINGSEVRRFAKQ